MDNLNQKIGRSIKWSTLTEVMNKLVAPITNMVLARLLTPDAFGVVATITMIISFAEIFSDAGFNRYIIQHEYKDDSEQTITLNTAFWTNLSISLLIWGAISIFSEQLAVLVGNPGLGLAIVVACVAIPLQAFSSIQMSLYKRNFDFKTLFGVRAVGLIVPLVVTIPLAYFYRSYWALIIGTVVTNILNAVILTYFSSWKPRLSYSFKALREMFSYSIWVLLDTILVWLTNYFDIFIIGLLLSQYYLGLYKTAMNVSGQIIALITASLMPVLFSTLSRLQNDLPEFKRTLLKFQKVVSILLVPLGFGIFAYSDFVTRILLGNQWDEASGFIGWWGLTSCLTITLSYFCSHTYPTLGKPRLSVVSQLLHLSFLLPTIYIAAHYSFQTLYLSRSLIRFQAILVNMIIVYFFIKITPLAFFKNIFPALISSAIVLSFALLFEKYFFTEYFYLRNIISIVLSLVLYILLITLFKQEKQYVVSLSKKVGLQFSKSH